MQKRHNANMFRYILALSLFLPLNALANSPVVAQVEKHLNNLNSFSATFQQFTPSEGYSSGIFYYQQPRKFLWQYQLPQNQKIVSTGSRMFFHDFETEQTTQIPMSSGFASFLTKQPLRLNDEDFKVLSSEELEGIINITLQLADDSSQQFNLRFESNPIKLLSMTQKGEFGTNLNITFANQKYNKPVDSELFKFTPELEKIPE